MKGHWWVHKRPQLIPSIKGVLGKEGRMSLCIAALTGHGDMGLSSVPQKQGREGKVPNTGLGGTGLTTFSCVATLLLASLCFLSGILAPPLVPSPHDPYSWLL